MMTLEKTTFVGFNNDVLKHDSYKRLLMCMDRHIHIKLELPTNNPEMGDLANTKRIAEILYHKLVDEFSMNEKEQSFFKNHLLKLYVAQSLTLKSNHYFRTHLMMAQGMTVGGDTNVDR